MSDDAPDQEAKTEDPSQKKLDDAQIPNKKNLLPALQNVSFDPGRQFTLTWQSGYAGLGWNKEKVKGGLKTIERDR